MVGADDAYERFNKEAKAWARATTRSFRSSVPRGSGTLAGSVGAKTYASRESLAVEAMRFTFERHGIYIEHGVGKGRPVGSSQANAAKQEWLGPVLETRISQLEDLIDQHYGDDTAKAIAAGLPNGITFKAA